MLNAKHQLLLIHEAFHQQWECMENFDRLRNRSGHIYREMSYLLYDQLYLKKLLERFERLHD